jgi:hypothetical protein
MPKTTKIENSKRDKPLKDEEVIDLTDEDVLSPHPLDSRFDREVLDDLKKMDRTDPMYKSLFVRLKKLRSSREACAKKIASINKTLEKIEALNGRKLKKEDMFVLY